MPGNVAAAVMRVETTMRASKHFRRLVTVCRMASPRVTQQLSSSEGPSCIWSAERPEMSDVR
jgi:hypothetical protein